MTTTTKTDGREVISYSTKETAQFIRQALRAEFKGVTFGVRIKLYSMGSSTYVSWTDGPTEPEVDLVLSRFTSKSFDGSDDSTHYHTQRDSLGREVSYSGYISTSRHFSPELEALAKARATAIGEDNVYRVMHTMRPGGLVVKVRPQAAA